MADPERRQSPLFAVVVVVLLIGVVALTSYSITEVSSLKGNVSSLQSQNQALGSQVGNLSSQVASLKGQLSNVSSASEGAISVYENISIKQALPVAAPALCEPSCTLGPIYVTFSSVMVQSSGGSWIPVMSSNRTVEMYGPYTYLGRAAVPAGNYTAVELTVASAVETISTFGQSPVNVTMAMTPGTTVQGPILHGAIVYASSVNLAVSFDNHLFGGTSTSPTLTLRIQSVSQL
jgi:hypothetical protein